MMLALCPEPSLSSSRQSPSDPLFVALCLQGPCSPHLFLHPVPLPGRGPRRPTSLAGGRPGRATNSNHQMGPVLGNAQKSLEENRRVTCVSVLPP